jgi:hypothetical protein
MAEREGFEPSVEVSPYTRLAGEHLKPTRSSLRMGLAVKDQVVDFYTAMNMSRFMAEGEGFEPPFPGRKAVFKTAALSHSAIPPSWIDFDFFSFYHSSASLSTTGQGSIVFCLGCHCLSPRRIG